MDLCKTCYNIGYHRVFVLRRTMFYTDRGANPHISKANYNGTNVVVLQDSDLSSPNGLAADFASVLSLFDISLPNAVASKLSH